MRGVANNSGLTIRGALTPRCKRYPEFSPYNLTTVATLLYERHALLRLYILNDIGSIDSPLNTIAECKYILEFEDRFKKFSYTEKRA
jgi:hypothetical protein